MHSTKITQVVAGLLVHPSNPSLVFMAQRSLERLRPGMWEYPGGRVEEGEEGNSAVEREWMEELGVRVISVRHPVKSVVFPFEDGDLKVSLYQILLLGPIEALQVKEHIAARWVRPADAIKHLACVPSTYLFYPDVRECVMHHIIKAM